MNKNTKYFKINNLNYTGIQYGFFSRLGGYSEKEYTSLNCNLNAGDQKEKVIKNIELSKRILDLNHTKIKFLNQTHSTNVAFINNKNFDTNIYADGGITIDKKICLAILTADCAPIFLFDTKNQLICALHSGWKGCLDNIINKALKKINNVNNDIGEIIAIIGPCLSHNYFEVSGEYRTYNGVINLGYFDISFLKTPPLNIKRLPYFIHALVAFPKAPFFLTTPYFLRVFSISKKRTNGFTSFFLSISILRSMWGRSHQKYGLVGPAIRIELRNSEGQV